MSRDNDDVEVSLDGVNDIECNPTHIANSKHTSIVEDCIKNVPKLDDDNNDENENDDHNEKQQIFRQSIKKEIERQQPENQHSGPFLSPECSSKKLPQQPTGWPHRPLMIRPTPFSSTKIIGIVSHYSKFNVSFCYALLFVNTLLYKISDRNIIY